MTSTADRLRARLADLRSRPAPETAHTNHTIRTRPDAGAVSVICVRESGRIESENVRPGSGPGFPASRTAALPPFQPPTGPVPGRGPCYACRQERWWRCTDADPSDCWTCGSCHPPISTLSVVWAKAPATTPHATKESEA